MRAFILVLIVSLSGLAPAAPSLADEKPRPEKAKLVPFSESSSQARLARSEHNVDFFRLANQFEPQMNGATCGPTSAVIVLNALRPPGDERRPVDATAFPAKLRKGLPDGWKPVKPRYTQRAFFERRFESVKPIERFYGAPDKEGKRDPGLQLRQLHDMLVAHGLDVSLRVVSDDLSAKKIKRDLIANLARPDDYVIINYQRKVLGQPGGGHISPVGAYDQKSDSFLVMDVNPNRAPWVWVPADVLIEAMRTHDTIENRGYLLVKEGTRAEK